MPKHGDKLYQCFTGELEVMIFYRENMPIGATRMSWLALPLEEHGKIPVRLRSISPNDWHLTEEAAYVEYRKNCIKYLPALKQAVLDAKQAVVRCRNEILRMNMLLHEIHQKEEAHESNQPGDAV